MQLSLAILYPLVGAAIYALASLALKRATAEGVGTWRVSFVVNVISALCYVPVWWFGDRPVSAALFIQGGLTGLIFFIGQVFTFLAITRGDLSVATPVLGTKVIFVALITVLALHQSITGALWGAALLTVVATALLGGGGAVVQPGQASFRRSLFYGFSAAGLFSITDILGQQWGPRWGYCHFAPVMFITLGLCSIFLVPFFHGPLTAITRRSWAWLLPGSILLAFQAGIVGYTIIAYSMATRVNVMYASRGLWTVIIVWVIGHWFGNHERGHGTGVMLRRMAGAALLLAAVVLVTRR